MKARIPMTCAQQRRIRDEMIREYRKVADEERDDMARRICKTILFILNRDFGFGVKRCARLFSTFADHLYHSPEDEVYWEHIDRVVIDQMGLPFERDYTDRGKVASNKSRRNSA